MQGIRRFIAEHEDELLESDYRATLQCEMAKKKPRESMVKVTPIAIGADYASEGRML